MITADSSFDPTMLKHPGNISDASKKTMPGLLRMAPLYVFILTPSDASHLILLSREKAKIVS